MSIIIVGYIIVSLITSIGVFNYWRLKYPTLTEEYKVQNLLMALCFGWFPPFWPVAWFYVGGFFLKDKNV